MVNQRLAIIRPSVTDIIKNHGLPIPSYEAFTYRVSIYSINEQLIEAALGRMLYGMSSRDYTPWDRKLK